MPKSKAKATAKTEATEQRHLRKVTRRELMAFDAGKSGRRLRGVPTAQDAINNQIKTYGRTVIARSRYLALNNPYAAAAKEEFVSGLVGSGIKPSSLYENMEVKKALQEIFMDWTDEADADWLTDFYGIQALIASEMFEAGECFVRFRTRLPQDGLLIPLQLQVLPSEMLDYDCKTLPNGNEIKMGVEYSPFGKREAYWFFKSHPDGYTFTSQQKSRIPAADVIHLFKPVRSGVSRGIPHTLSAITKLALMDQYDDAELERKKVAALFAAFITRPWNEGDEHPFENEDGLVVDQTPYPIAPLNAIPFEPGAMVDLDIGEDIKFSEPADVGGNYEVFQYRTLLAIAAGFGVPYSSMTGDLRQTNYSSIRAGLVTFRRRIEAMQHSVMIYQFCRPVWKRWLHELLLVNGGLPPGERLVPITLGKANLDIRKLYRVKWIPPKWEWVDPEKDLKAEKLAVDEGFKCRDDVIESGGYDAEEVDIRIAASNERAKKLGIKLGDEKKAAAQPEPVAPAGGAAKPATKPVKKPTTPKKTE